jgi:O-antigen ligase
MEVLEKAVPSPRWTRKFVPGSEPLRDAFFWLSAFYLVYCARPEDWIPGLKYIPLAKISGIFAVLGLLSSAGKSKRGLRDLPREAKYLAAIIGLLIGAALLSPVWKGGALVRALDFSKVLVAWVLTFLVITNFKRLRQIIFIQSASVVVIVVVSLLKGRDHLRLEGVIGGIYSNPNDLAFAIVLSLPFCVAFLLHTRSIPRKLIWTLGMLAMCTALFLTASRGGFITLLVTGAVGLWHFGVKGKRLHLIAVAALMALVVGVSAGGRLKDRFLAISGEDLETGMEVGAHGSYEQRRFLMIKSLEGIEHYPLGIGLGNFPSYSGVWREVHVAYLQIAVEGGIAAFIFYLLFFGCGFSNLRRLRRMAGYDEETELFARALHSSLIGFLVGALFAPEAYQYFPYFAVGYTSVLLAFAKEKAAKEPVDPSQPQLRPKALWEGGRVHASPVGER